MKACIVLISFLIAATLNAKDANSLASFHILSDYISDSLPDWHYETIEALSRNDDVLVRSIRISEVNSPCSDILVRSADRPLPKSTVLQTAGIDFCAYSEEQVKSAIHAAQRQNHHASIMDSSCAWRGYDSDHTLTCCPLARRTGAAMRCSSITHLTFSGNASWRNACR
jgi:hypothetical protein